MADDNKKVDLGDIPENANTPASELNDSELDAVVGGFGGKPSKPATYIPAPPAPRIPIPYPSGM